MQDGGDRITPILQMSALCDGVAQDPNSKKFSLVGLFDFIVRPIVMPQFFVCNKWTNGLGTFREQVEILGPDLHPVVPVPSAMEFTLTTRTNPVVNFHGFVNFVFGSVGVYWIQVKLDDELVLAYPLPVLSPPEGQPLPIQGTQDLQTQH